MTNDKTRGALLLASTTLLAAFVATACGESAAPVASTSAQRSAAPVASTPKGATPSAAPVESATPTVQSKMKEHFDSAATMRAALIRGDLDAFRQAASVLSDKDLGQNIKDDWKAHLEDMRLAAKNGRDAKDLAAATSALADTGEACASCHTKLGAPKLALPAEPAAGSGSAAHMRRHAWATDLMWMGLSTPSQDAWVRGTEVFAEAALEPEQVAGQKSVPAEVAELAKLAHAAGAEAHDAKPDGRGKAYAKVMTTCTTCHDKLSIKPK